MASKELPTKTGPAEADFLRRRERSVFVETQKSWSDARAWLFSCLFHTFLIVGCALLWRPQTRGTAGEADRPFGIAVVHETNQGNEYFLQGGSSGAKQASVAAASQAASVLASDSAGPPISLSEVLSSLVGTEGEATTSLNAGTGGGLTGDGQSGSGTGPSKGPGNKAKTSFFGLEGSGQSFVYVVDRSDSMNAYGAGPLRYAKREMIKSLSSLNEYHQFQVVFYNDSIYPMSTTGSAGRMNFATDSDKRRASSFVKSMPGDGGTEHLPALKLALSLAPDVIFFLTDAEDPSLSVNQLLEIQQRAEIKGTTIHAIQFNIGPDPGSGGWIQALAEMNRGTYRYLDVTTFEVPADPPAEENSK